jgi:hypothetical protein
MVMDPIRGSLCYLQGIWSFLRVSYRSPRPTGNLRSSSRARIEYKAKVAGVPMLMVDPRDTSKRCSRCGHVEKRNRVSQSEFKCCRYGFEENADLNAARNIQWRAEVNQPIVVCPSGNLNYKPTPLGVGS